MSSSKEIDQLAAALVGAQSDFEAVGKTAENPFYKSKYAPLPEVVKAATPVLVKHGLAVSQHIDHSFIPSSEGYQGRAVDTLITYLLHSSGQYITSEMLLHLPKDDPQGQGSAVTYARRYAYMSVLGLVADFDDDGEAASPKVPAPSAPPAPRGSAISRPPGTPKSAEKPVEARVSAADAKRELILDAVDKGHDDFNAKLQAKKAWGDRGTEAIMRSELLLLLMSIDKP